MKKELGPRRASPTAHHFFTLLNFITLLIAVASLFYNVHLLRREIETLKADVRPLLEENKKTASRPLSDFVFRSRDIRQIEPGADEGGGHGMSMTTEAPPDGGGGGHGMMGAMTAGPHQQNGANQTNVSPHTQASNHGGMMNSTQAPDHGGMMNSTQAPDHGGMTNSTQAPDHGGMMNLTQAPDHGGMMNSTQAPDHGGVMNLTAPPTIESGPDHGGAMTEEPPTAPEPDEESTAGGK